MRGSAAQNIERAEILLEGYLNVASHEDVPEQQQASEGFLVVACRYARVSAAQRRAIIIRMALYAVGALALSVVFASKWPLLVGVVAAYLEYSRLRRKAQARAQSFERDYTAMLLSLASAIRTGLDPLAAILQLGKLFSPTSEVHK
ncbi:MAG: hypothetical protein EBZ48_12360, partial [Proteobacteria bacterium]|nr:hypothetical protein [Pseudomonadota bacterium]